MSITTSNDDTHTLDPGLIAIGLLLRLHGVTADLEQLRRRCGATPIGPTEMLRTARKFDLHAVVRQSDWNDLAAQLPAIVSLRGGGCMIIGRLSDEGAVVLRPPSLKAELLTQPALEQLWDGELVTVAGKLSWSDRAKDWLQASGVILKQASNRILKRKPGSADSGVGTNAAGLQLESDSSSDQASSGESGLGALVLLLRIHRIGAEAGQIRHRCGTATIGVPEMLRCAKELGLKARVSTTTWERPAATPLPGIAALRDGRFLIVGKAAEDKVLVQHPSSPKPEVMTKAEFEAIWDGRLVLMARRASLADLSRRF